VKFAGLDGDDGACNEKSAVAFNANQGGAGENLNDLINWVSLLGDVLLRHQVVAGDLNLAGEQHCEVGSRLGYILNLHCKKSRPRRGSNNKEVSIFVPMKRIEVITLLNSLAKSSYTESRTVEAVLYHVRPYSYVVMLDKDIVLCDQAGLTESFRRYKDLPRQLKQFLRIQYQDMQYFKLIDNQLTAVLWSTVTPPLQLEFASLDDIVLFQTTITRHGEVLRTSSVVWSRPRSLDILWPPAAPLSYGELYTATPLVELRREIFDRGLRPEARLRGWLLMLELIPRSSDKNLGAFANRDMRDDYLRYRRQWHRMTDEQKQLNTSLQQTVAQIEKDVARLGEELNSRVEPEVVMKILVAYALYDVDINYAQGMADITGSILLVTKEPHLAFACLKKFMQHFRVNFSPEGVTVQRQLGQFRLGLAVLCPELGYRETWHPVVYRWLLLLFQREMPAERFQRVMDAYFATHSTDSAVMLAVAAFVQSRHRLVEFGDDQGEVCEYFADYWRTADFEFLLAVAKAISPRCLSQAATPYLSKIGITY